HLPWSAMRRHLELRRSNDWAERLTAELGKANERIVELQNELPRLHAGYTERIGILNEEAAERLAWVADLESQISGGNAEIGRLREEQTKLENTLDERTV